MENENLAKIEALDHRIKDSLSMIVTGKQLLRYENITEADRLEITMYIFTILKQTKILVLERMRLLTELLNLE